MYSSFRPITWLSTPTPLEAIFGEAGTSSMFRGLAENTLRAFDRDFSWNKSKCYKQKVANILQTWFSGLARTDFVNCSISALSWMSSFCACWLLLIRSAVFIVMSSSPLFANMSAVLSNRALFSGAGNWKARSICQVFCWKLLPACCGPSVCASFHFWLERTDSAQDVGWVPDCDHCNYSFSFQWDSEKIFPLK